MGGKKHDHTRTEAVFYWYGHGPGGGRGCRHGPRQFSFLPFCLTHVAFSPFPSSLSLPLIDKDKANLFGNQGHGWCRQTLLLRFPPEMPPRPPLFFTLFFPQYFVFFDSIAAAASRRRRRSSGSAKPHSCHTPAPLQCISSSRGHGSVSAVITAGILIIIFQRRNVFFMQIKKGEEAAIGKQ